ncbi:MAG: spore coat U domain-containing protein [Caulobacteraceae bacterium]
MKPMTLLLFGMVLALATLLNPRPANAVCNPLSLCSCTASATGVSFGAYNPLSTTPNDATGTVTVSCILTVSLTGSYTIALSTGASNSFTARSLQGGGSTLAYNLYVATARTQVWGDGTGGTQTVTGSFPAILTNTQSFNVFGRIPAGQNVPVGAYTDTIIVTVTY